MHKGKLILASLASLALPLAAQAQTRTRRTPAQRPASRRTAPAAAAAAPTNGSVNLSAEDVALLVEGLSLPSETTAKLATDAEERRNLAKRLRRMFAAAAEARAGGAAERPDLKLQLELARSFGLAQAYFNGQKEAGVKDTEQIVSAAEIDAFLNDPANAAKLDAFVADYAKNGPGRGAPLTDADRKNLARQYARVMVGTRKGIAAGLERDRKTQLTIMFQQARLLAGAYAADTADRFNATDAEVDAYVAAHPEFDTKAARARAEDVLRRVRAGEDFAALAGEFSEDPGSRTRGGDLGWFGRGVMVKPFEEAAFALKPGEVSGIVESQFGYHIIKLEERRAAASGGEEVHARHILVGYGAAGAGGGPPMNPRERARAAVEDEKRERALDEAAARRRITVAENYVVGLEVIAPVAQPGAQGRTPAGTNPPAQSQPGAKPKTTTPARRAPARRRP